MVATRGLLHLLTVSHNLTTFLKQVCDLMKLNISIYKSRFTFLQLQGNSTHALRYIMVCYTHM